MTVKRALKKTSETSAAGADVFLYGKSASFIFTGISF
ncbi:hypothetical protein BHY07_09205 [Bacillus subtilis subsp. subtilis]|nr:hypothetical protein M036_08780 [Bacillus subtilis TO-A]AIY92976.1 hypothetical protein QU35_09225 [Bacillus subtilis subsp. subtilis str. 168]AIY97286.1 hypothetical protein QX56_09220 [Bacillus subtilis]AJE94356.1 hypothetical protein RP72_09105 [Bacillus subtilis subsp. subtilis]AKC47230.1 hypothetical protein O7A_09220 [Bacillus subtilis KCTC 1028 = ATCC 6051a]AOL27466.1 hypothetical protein BGM23_13090 [Bacillus sp. FJAT-14266]AOL29614.1 hypothetical protein BGM20_02760 [Alkalicoccoba